ncbi:unnamed protein product, partial [Choristocarpus tenellus]
KKDADRAVSKRKEEVRLRRKQEEQRRHTAFMACRAGGLDEIKAMLDSGLIRCTERERDSGQSGASLLHACVTEFGGAAEVVSPGTGELAKHRLGVLLECANPQVDAGVVDTAGLTVLHRVAEALDLPYLGLLLEERKKSQERRNQIQLNEPCLSRGWTPLHYVAAEASTDGVSTLLAAGARVNFQAKPPPGDVSVISKMGLSSSRGGRNANGGLHGGGGGWGLGDGGGVGAVSKAGATALEVVRALLSQERSGGMRKKMLQEVARQLDAAAQEVERAKELRERKEREAKV